MTYFYRRYHRGQRGNGIGLRGIFRSLLSKRNLEKGAQKILKFGSDVLKKHTDNPDISLFDATKKTAKETITSGVNNFFNRKSIKSSSERDVASSSLKRKVKTSKKKPVKKAKLSGDKFTL